jgi:hypothetical protein
MKLEPYKSQPVVFRAIGGATYAAIITDVRDGREVHLTTFMPNSPPTYVSYIRYYDREAEAPEKGQACYPGR